MSYRLNTYTMTLTPPLPVFQSRLLSHCAFFLQASEGAESSKN